MSDTSRWSIIKQEFDEAGDYHGDKHLRLCLHVLLYYEGLFADTADDILNFYQTALPHIREHVRYYGVDGNFRLKKVKKSTFDMLPFWAQAVDEERLQYGLVLESGVSNKDRSDRAFHLYQRGIVSPGFVRLMLPIETVADGADGFVELVHALVGDMPVIYGNAGFALSYYGGGYAERVLALSRRYRGVDMAEPYDFRSYVTEGIPSAHWITILGERFMKSFEGGVASRVGPDVTVTEATHATIIQAGPMPSFGEVNRRDTLPLVHQVGRALARVRIPETALGEYNGIGDGPNTREWLARFDPPHDA